MSSRAPSLASSQPPSRLSSRSPELLIQEKQLPPPPKQKFKVKSWAWEALSFIVSTTCISAMLIIMLHFDNKPVPDWQWLTLNSVISGLGVLSKAALILPIAEAISQLKWYWFWTPEKPRHVIDFQLYDDAFRGPWGGLCFLSKPRLMHFASLGALLTVAALGMEPSIQQIPVYTARLGQKLTQSASIARTSIYKDFEYDSGDFSQPILGTGIKGAIYSGIFGSYDEQGNSPSCPTGNCTWPTYTSLAVCNECANITSLVHVPNLSIESVFSLPNGLNFTEGYNVFQLTSAGRGFSNWSVEFPHTHNLSILDTISFFYPPTTSYTLDPPHTFECMLYFCVNSYNASVSNGTFNEDIVESWPDPRKPLPEQVWNDRNVQIFERGGLYEFQEDDNITLPAPESLGGNYTINAQTMISLNTWISNLVQGAISSDPDSAQITTSDILQVFYNMQTSKTNHTEKHAEFGSFADYWAAADQMPGPQRLFDRIAGSMTTYMRSKSREVALGDAQVVQTFVQARWIWATVPVALLVLTFGFVIGTAALSARREIPVWKSHSLPSLIHGLDDGTCRVMGASTVSLDKMEENAKSFQATMKLDQESWKLEGRRKGVVWHDS